MIPPETTYMYSGIIVQLYVRYHYKSEVESDCITPNTVLSVPVIYEHRERVIFRSALLHTYRMAKKKGSVVLRLVSQAGTGFFYTLRKAVRPNAEKCARTATLHKSIMSAG